MSIRFRDKTNHRDITLGGIPYLFSRTRAGLTPKAPSGSGTTKYLREDGTWVAPPDTTKGNSITTNAAKTGSGTTVTNTIAANTTMDNAIGTLLNNDVALANSLKDFIKTVVTTTATVAVASKTIGTTPLVYPTTPSGYKRVGLMTVQTSDMSAQATLSTMGDSVVFYNGWSASLNLKATLTWLYVRDI